MDATSVASRSLRDKLSWKAPTCLAGAWALMPTDSAHNMPVAPYELDIQFDVEEPNRV